MVTATPGILLKTCVARSGSFALFFHRCARDADDVDDDDASSRTKRPRFRSHAQNKTKPHSDIPIVQYLKHLNEKQAPM